jgi:phosphate transport system permease protein
MISRGFGAAAVLLLLVLVLFLIARVIGGRGAGELSRRGTHRRVLASRRDQRRFAERAAVRGGPLGGPSPAASAPRTPQDQPAQGVDGS